jgi:hypothetical protein
MKNGWNRNEMNFKKNSFKVLAAGAAFALLLVSCSKDDNNDKTCYECEQLLEKLDHQVIIESSSSTTSQCDKSEKEIKAFEEENNYDRTSNGIQEKSTMKCKLK